MAPRKSFRTYGRQNNSSISCVEAFDILFAKNLTQRKLLGKNRKGKNKFKYEIKELPTKIKTVLNDDSSLHINVNDTFDKLLKKSPKYVKYHEAETAVSKSSFSVIKCLNSFSNVSPMLQKLRSYNSDKSATKNAIDSWFNHPTPPEHQITNTIEIEKVKPKSKNASKSRSGRSSPILLRSQSQKLSTKSSLNCDNNVSNQAETTKNNTNTTFATTRNNCLFTDSVRERILMHCSTPVAPKKSQRLIGQPISPIKNQDQVNSCIVESLNEIRSWNLSIPQFESHGGCMKNDTEQKSHLEPPKRSLSFNLEDFESFFEQLKNKSQLLQQRKSVSMHDFEQFNREVFSCQINSDGKVIKTISLEEFESFYQSYQNNMDSFFDSCRKTFNFVTHRKHRYLTPSKKVHFMKELVVLLDNNLMNYSASTLIKQDKAGCPLMNTNNDNNKQLTVKLKRLSLDKLKLTLNQRGSNLFKAKKRRTCNRKFKACRKFSSNTPMLLPNNSVRISIGASVNSGLADNSNISLGNLFNTKSRLSNSFGWKNEAVLGNEVCFRDSLKSNNSSSMRISALKTSPTGNSDKSNPDEKPYIAELLVVSTNDDTRFEALEASMELKGTSLSKRRYTLPTKSCKKYTPAPRHSCQPSLKVHHQPDLETSIRSNVNSEYFAQDLSESILVEMASPPRQSSNNQESFSPSNFGQGQAKGAKNSLNASVILIDDDDDDDDNEKLDKIDDSPMFKIPQGKEEVHLKAGKSWRRSLMQHKRESIIYPRRSSRKLFDPLRLTDHVRHSPKIVASDEAKRLRRRTALQSYVYSGMLNDTCDSTPQKSLAEPPMAPITARDIVLTYCNQSEPEPFEKTYPDSNFGQGQAKGAKNSLNASVILMDDDDDDDGDNEKLDKIDDSPIFKIPQGKEEVHLKAGKSWRRSLMQHKRESIIYPRRSSRKLFDPLRLTDHVRHSPKIVASDEAKRLRRRTTLQSYVYSGMLNDTCDSTPQKPLAEPPVAPITARDIVLTYCNQSEPVPFEKAYPDSLLQGCKKIGEGVYGEVFLYPQPDGGTTVMKVIPIEGDKIVNGERQKKFHEILSEVAIVSQLSNLRNNVTNRTSSFCEVQRISCLKGKYPKVLLNVWYDYDNSKGSENDAPDRFDDNQLYIVLDLANAGQDLEAFVFNNASQAFAMFNQVALALAVAEEHLKFEHRDLHWGNILLRAVDKNKKVVFKHKGRFKECASKGVEATIIDFTLSRMSHDGVVIFNDLGQDPDIFLGEGDYQFDVYRLMKERNNNDWQHFTPYSNILWLHYVIKKSITALRYKNTKTQIHKKFIDSFKKYERDILRFNSVCEFVDEFL